MTILMMAASPSERSRSAALLEGAGVHLGRLGANLDRLVLRELPAQALLQGELDDKHIGAAIELVHRATAIVVATPVYKAAYSGLLKVFLDLLPQTSFKGKTVLPLATGGSPHHMLALDYALRPVLQSLSVKQVLAGVYATDAQVTLTPEGAHFLAADLGLRLGEACADLVDQTQELPATAGFEPIAFGRVRCSV